MSKIKFNIPYLSSSGNENLYVSDVINGSHFSGNGKYTLKCHDLISNIIDCRNVLLTDSCTSALEICASLIRDYSSKQEVIIPSYTFSSTAAAFAKLGFKVIFCDIDENSMMMDVEDAVSKITEKTAAIIAVHYGGDVLNLDKLSLTCKEKNIKLVEDAAQAFGCSIDKKKVGTIGDYACFSFHETKNLHAGLAGCFVAKNKNDMSRATFIWERGTNRSDVLKGVVDKYTWVEIGGSYYPSELQAAFLFAQLESFDINLSKRKELHNQYVESFKQLQLNIKKQDISNSVKHNGHAFWIKLPSEDKLTGLIEFLRSKEIDAYIGYVPLHDSPISKKLNFYLGTLPITESESKLILRLPIHCAMSVSDVKSVVMSINSYLQG